MRHSIYNKNGRVNDSKNETFLAVEMIVKRIFSKGETSVIRSIRISERMNQALIKIAEVYGDSVNSHIVDLIEQHLQERAKAGEISWPEVVPKPDEKNSKIK